MLAGIDSLPYLLLVVLISFRQVLSFMTFFVRCYCIINIFWYNNKNDKIQLIFPLLRFSILFRLKKDFWGTWAWKLRILHWVTHVTPQTTFVMDWNIFKIQFDPTWSDLIQFDPIWSPLPWGPMLHLKRHSSWTGIFLSLFQELTMPLWYSKIFYRENTLKNISNT